MQVLSHAGSGALATLRVRPQGLASHLRLSPTTAARGQMLRSRQPSVAPRAAAAADGAAAAVPAAAVIGGGVQGDMLVPSVANKQWVRLLAVAAVVAAAARGSAFLPATGTAFVHVLAYGTWLGAIVWTSFVAGIVMFKNLPRQTFGKLQSKLFPIYFGLLSACAAVMLGVLTVSAGAPPRRELVLLGLGLATSAANWLFVEPKATSLMFQRYELENVPQRDEGAIKALYKKFGMWHGISSMLNLVTLVVAVGHGWWLASLLAPGLLV